MFTSVVTIELSDPWFERAAAELATLSNVTVEHGSSPSFLSKLDPAPTLYWLDAHCCGNDDTAGADDPCPALDEIAAIPPHPADCLFVDDARLFAATRRPESWPTLVRVIDALGQARPAAHVTVLHDLILCVPMEAKDLVDDFGMRHTDTIVAAGEEARREGDPVPQQRRLIAGLGRLGITLSRSGHRGGSSRTTRHS